MSRLLLPIHALLTAICAGGLCGAAAGATLYVGPGHYATIQSAVDAAGDFDTIRVAQGTYTEAVNVAKSLTLEGGWNASFTARDWSLFVTTIDAGGAGSTLKIDGATTTTVEGFVITGGDASVPLGWGGGIWIDSPWDEDPGLATIRNNLIAGNVAAATSGQGYGGGIMVYSSAALIEHNTIAGNTACARLGKSGHGGGVAVWGRSRVSVANNLISGNLAATSATEPFATGEGGGFFGDGAIELTVSGNLVENNVAAREGPGEGGGVFGWGEVSDNRIRNNTATLAGAGQGGGVYAHYVTRLKGNTIEHNTASASGDGEGGGVYGYQCQLFEDNAIENNNATRGGGVYLGPHNRITMRRNVIRWNAADGANQATLDGGGGLWTGDLQAVIVDNQISSNTTGLLGTGGGVYVTTATNLVLTDNWIAWNMAGLGGGLAVNDALGEVARNQLSHNAAFVGGGALVTGWWAPDFDANLILDNVAAGAGFPPVAGGGVAINLRAGVPVTLTNHVIARNWAGPWGLGGGVVCFSGLCRLYTSTIVANNAGPSKEGVLLQGGGGNHVVRGNIIDGCTTGVQAFGGALVDLNYNDFFGNVQDFVDIVGGVNNVFLDPQFVNRAAGDYHLALASQIVDKGDDLAPTDHDAEGDPRPRGAHFDIGADEAYRAVTYVSAATGNDLTGDGSPGAPFFSMLRAFAETRTGGAINVARGVYPCNYPVTRSVELRGGYRETDWTRDIAAHETILDGQHSDPVMHIFGENVRALIEGFTIRNGATDLLGGGLAVRSGAYAIIRRNTIRDNLSEFGGGGLSVSGSEWGESLIEANRIAHNTSLGLPHPGAPAPAGVPAREQGGAAPGGGLLVIDGPVRATNNMIYGNTSGAGGDGIGIWLGESKTALAVNNTIVDNTPGTGTGVELRGSQGTAVVHNNLIVGHGVGIRNHSGATLNVDYNGFHGNQIIVDGLAPGVYDVFGAPHFADRAGEDYHLRRGSVAFGAGNRVDGFVPATDIDGDARPWGIPAPDLGADEAISSDDIRAALLQTIPWTASLLVNADVNGDGQIDIADMLQLLAQGL